MLKIDLGLTIEQLVQDAIHLMERHGVDRLMICKRCKQCVLELLNPLPCPCSAGTITLRCRVESAKSITDLRSNLQVTLGSSRLLNHTVGHWVFLYSWGCQPHIACTRLGTLTTTRPVTLVARWNIELWDLGLSHLYSLLRDLQCSQHVILELMH